MGDLLSAMERSGRFEGTKFSFLVGKKLAAFKQACLENAGDNKIIERIEWATASFEAAIDDRNALAHGAAELFPDRRVVEVLKFSPSNKDKHSIQKFTYNLDNMEHRIREFDNICRNIIGLSWALAGVLALTNQLKPGWSIEIEENL
ncbi:hypothetical protein ACJ3XI_06860 [Litorimonas sp. RW-G-Af-16]|uniref:hypothetical protein n=1 Tax=Litorimonas sp. RW-G-Af-16 TaxID=3241168 RepID=UPI00390CCC5E